MTNLRRGRRDPFESAPLSLCKNKQDENSKISQTIKSPDPGQNQTTYDAERNPEQQQPKKKNEIKQQGILETDPHGGKAFPVGYLH